MAVCIFTMALSGPSPGPLVRYKRPVAAVVQKNEMKFNNNHNKNIILMVWRSKTFYFILFFSLFEKFFARVKRNIDLATKLKMFRHFFIGLG